jgi:hypothetical protein
MARSGTIQYGIVKTAFNSVCSFSWMAVGVTCAGILEKSVGTRNRVGKGLYSNTDPPGYIGSRNRFLGIDSWAPLKFKSLACSFYVGRISGWGRGEDCKELDHISKFPFKISINASEASLFDIQYHKKPTAWDKI